MSSPRSCGRGESDLEARSLKTTVPKSQSPRRPGPTQPARPAGRARLAGLAGLGRALRWLRERQGRRQYQLAEKAGITKGMLSAYETGKQSPSLETLGKLLATLDCDLSDLHNAIQIVNGTPEAPRAWQGSGAIPRAAGLDLHRPPGLTAPPLAGEEERALAQILAGFHTLIRYWHHTLAALRSRAQP
jgi:transcriptional regulator with XRE-family HTH domain